MNDRHEPKKHTKKIVGFDIGTKVRVAYKHPLYAGHIGIIYDQEWVIKPDQTTELFFTVALINNSDEPHTLITISKRFVLLKDRNI